MNLDKLKEVESAFLMRYPLGFEDPGLVPIKKKLNVDKMISLAQTNLTQLNCLQPQFVAKTLVISLADHQWSLDLKNLHFESSSTLSIVTRKRYWRLLSSSVYTEAGAKGSI